ncbi:MAG: transglycosylase SLT domain-containing protein [Bacteroidota bacterium]
MTHKLLFFLFFGAMIMAPTVFLNAQEVKIKDAAIDYDFYPEIDYDLVADRLSCLQNEVELNFNVKVYGFIDYFAVRNRDYTQNTIDESGYFFPIFEEYLEKYNLPQELKYLAVVESGLNQQAISRAGAGGLWQFMPSTGRMYGLHKDWYIDERMDPYMATEAACKYLKELYSYFHDWELALAAYNAGPGKVRRAIRRSGYKKKFWDIYPYLPRETRSYVPQFVAITYIFNYAHEHNFDPNHIKTPIAFETITVDDYMNLATVGKMINGCEDDLKLLNPSIKRDALPDGVKKYPVRIPTYSFDAFKMNELAILDSAKKSNKKEIEYLSRNSVGSTYGREKRIHRVKYGEVLGTIAERYQVRVSDLRKWNGIRGNMIRSGQRLNIWVYPGTKERTVAKVKPETTRPDIILPSGTKVHLVMPGDTLWDISKMYEGLSIEKIKKLNNLTSNKIKPGQKLIVG